LRLKSAGVKPLLIYTLLLLGFSLLVLKDFLGPGYPPSWGGDSYGHLFKIWKLMEGYSPWIEDWYGGYPFLRFYPPLSYLVGAFFGLVTGSAIWGYKLTVLLAFLLAGLSTRALLREMGFSELLSSAGGSPTPSPPTTSGFSPRRETFQGSLQSAWPLSFSLASSTP